MKQSTKRILVDIILVILLVFEMFYLVTGNLAHEFVGVAFFVCLGFHLYLSRKMAAGLFAKRKEDEKRGAKRMLVHRVVDILLFTVIALLLISSLFISNLLIGAGFAIDFGSYGLWALIHTVSAYALCAVVIFHGALHWASLFKGMRISYNPQRRQAITNFATTCAILGTAALGIASVDSLKNHFQAYVTEKNTGEAPDASISSNADKDISVQENRRRDDSGSSTYGQRSDRQRPSASMDDPIDSENNNGKRSSSSTSDDTDICPLCPKRCRLSNPRCNKPYQAGLI